MNQEQTIKTGNSTSVSGQNLRVRTRDEWLAKGKELYGEKMGEWKFRCPSCGHVQTGNDFKKLKADGNFDGVIESVVYFSCIGRWLPEATGTIFNKARPCNYTNGGLLCITDDFVKIEDDEGCNGVPVFPYADEEAHA